MRFIFISREAALLNPPWEDWVWPDVAPPPQCGSIITTEDEQEILTEDGLVVIVNCLESDCDLLITESGDPLTTESGDRFC